MFEPDITELVEGCLAGERKAQKQVYEMHYSKMLGVCIRYTKNVDQAKDILQDGFIKVFKNIGKYNQHGSFEGWIRRIIVNTCIDYFRKNRNDFVLLGENESMEAFMDPEDYEENEEESGYEFKASQVIEALQFLSPAYRTVFNLYVFENLRHHEIAEKLGVSVGTSKSNLAKAKKNLKKILLKEFRKTDGE